jgi:hypothetical protein
MVYFIPINEQEVEGGSVTYYRVDCGDVSVRTAKRKLREFLTVVGLEKHKQKKFINELVK